MSILQDIDLKKAEIEKNISYKDLNSYFKSLQCIKSNEITTSLYGYSNEEIDYALEEIYSNIGLIDDQQSLVNFVKVTLNTKGDSLKLNEEELLYLIELLEKNPDIDTAMYEKILKLNYNYKYKNRIDDLLVRKHNKSIFLNSKPIYNKENIYKMFLSVMNYNVKNFYSISKEEIFKNLAKQDKIYKFLISIGQRKYIDELKNAYALNDYNKIYKICENINIKNEDYNKLILLLNEKEVITKYDYSRISFKSKNNLSFDSFIKTNDIPFDLITKALNLVMQNFKEDLLKNNLDFNAAISKCPNLEYVLLELKDMFKKYGFEIDMDFIKDDILDLDYIKELFILKTLYRILNIVNLKKISIDDINTKEKLINELEEFKENLKFNNLADKLNQKDVKNDDIKAILLLYSGHTSYKKSYNTQMLAAEVNKLNLSTSYSLKDKFSVFSNIERDKRNEEYNKYFTDLKALPYLTDSEKDREVYMEMISMNQRKLLDLLEPDIYANTMNIIDFIRYLKNQDKDIEEDINKVSKTTDEIVDSIKERPALSYKDVIDQYVLEQEEIKETINQVALLAKNKSVEEVEIIKDQMDKMININIKIEKYKINLEKQERQNINIKLDDDKHNVVYADVLKKDSMKLKK